MIKRLRENFKANKVKFLVLLLSFLVGIITLIVYLSTGILPGFTERYSIGAIILTILAILIGGLDLFFRIPGVDVLPFAFYLSALLCFFSVESNYLVAVIRAIDVTSVSAGFVSTIVLYLIAAVTNIVGVFYHFSIGILSLKKKA